jgi:hypothetical protein
MLFIFPGLELFMRINGRGRVSTDAALLEQLSEGGRAPKTTTVVAIDEVLVHCGKAVNRAKLWSPESQLDRNSLPTVGQMVAKFGKLADPKAEMDASQVAQVNQHYDHAVRNDLY